MSYDYLKFIRWSDEDRVFIGYCPDLFIGGVCHGQEEQAVYKELCQHVARELADIRHGNKTAPVARTMVAMAFAP